MKNVFKTQAIQRIAGIVVLIAAVGFFMTACGGDGGGGNGGHLIMGRFSEQAAGIDATFYADITSNVSPNVRAARSATTGQMLVGKVEDGDIIFNLTGFYYSATGEFVLSAGSSFLIYEIAGTVTSSAISAIARVKIKQGSDWEAFEIAVTAVNEVDITGSVSTDQDDGFPASWLGKWTVIDETGYWEHGFACDYDCNDDCVGGEWFFNDDMDMTIAPFALFVFNEVLFPLDILELTQITATKFDIVVLGEAGSSYAVLGCSDDPCVGGNSCCYVHDEEYFVYLKIRLEQDGANLLMKVPLDEIAERRVDEPGALEAVKAFDVDSSTELFIWRLER